MDAPPPTSRDEKAAMAARSGIAASHGRNRGLTAPDLLGRRLHIFLVSPMA